MQRRALIVGIDDYDHATTLYCCVNDANKMKDILNKNEDRSPNYECLLLTSTDREPVTRKRLRKVLNETFNNFPGDVLFYFSGHGDPSETGGYIVTQDGEQNDVGIPMDEILTLAIKSPAKSILLVLDCCFSGNIGNPSILQDSSPEAPQKSFIRQGMTILAASRPTEPAMEFGGHGVFTRLVLGALAGGAADVRGRISAAAVYAYVEQSLGAWHQRPIYKSYAHSLDPIRLCVPSVPDVLLRQLPLLFLDSRDRIQLDPTYEHTIDTAIPSKVEVFDKLKILRNARLLLTEDNEDLYYIALKSKKVMLSPLGQFYWMLASDGRI